MSSIAFDTLAQQFSLNPWIIASWCERFGFTNTLDATNFFSKKENQAYIQAQPFVKWVGGKRQLITQFKELFPNPQSFNNYFEPFLGGGAVYFNLQKKKSYLSDMNAELINTYQVIKSEPKKLIKYLKNIEHSKEKYLEIRAWDRVAGWQEQYTDIERAARFIYLNRTCFNGLHRVNSRGEFNVPMGAYKNPDYVQEKNILNVSELLQRTEADIRVESFEHVLDDNKAKADDFIYFDPPYDTLTDTANFTSYNKDSFGHDMQRKLAETFHALDKRGCKVMLSNHNTPFIRELYRGFRFEIVQARRAINSNANGRGEVEEIVVLNY